MPRSKSVLKRQRQSERKRQRNQSVRSSLRTSKKAASTAVASGTDAQPAVRNLQRQADRAATKGVIHKNKASRLKSRATRALNKASSG